MIYNFVMNTEIANDHAVASDMVYQTLVQWIRQGELRAGQRLVQEELGHRLGVSATPIREALRRLESDGVLVRAPHSGMYVRTWDFEDARALYEARHSLEGKVAELTASRASEEEVVKLQKMVDDQIEALRIGARGEAQYIDTEFHLAMGQYAQSSVLNSLLGKVWLLVPVLRATVWDKEQPVYLDHMIPDHQLLIQCIAHRAERAAREVAERHVEKAWERLQEANWTSPQA